MVFKSRFPAVQIPDLPIPNFVFDENPIMGYNDVPSFVDGISGRAITFGQQKSYVEQLGSTLANPSAAGFKLQPVKEGVVVGIVSPNHVLYPTALWGILRAGGTATTANAAYTVDELIHQLSDSGAKLLITHPQVIGVALEAAKKVGIPESSVMVFEHDEATKKAGYPTVDDLISAGAKLAPLPKLSFKPGEAAKRVAFLCYSSGTTGRAKGVMISHKNVVSNVCQFRGFDGDSLQPGIDKLMGVLPMYHIYALILLVHIATFSKVTTVVLPRFEPQLFLDTIEKYKITIMHLVPPIIVALAKMPLVENYTLASVRDIFSGAAPLGKEVSDELVERLMKLRKKVGSTEHVVLRQGWGMTETSTVVTANPLQGGKPGSVGLLLPNLEARVVDPDTGKDCAVGQEGEIWVRGPNVVIGYLNNEKANAETFDNEGYIHTGDVVTVDEDGYFTIRDRIKELIKVKGLQVAPAELEALLLTHPLVADSAVIPVPDERAGELPKAFCVLKTPAKDATERAKVAADIAKFIEGKVARHKWLAGGIDFVDVIPKSPSGKILRRLLRDAEREKLKAKL
ncbi:hypothetical protein DFJ74DRAFT_665759 [Hyaloraphidium curvatum]|nr:hypothetical protein DFJ74DRAFT_665759 [Hyaloraphidium curvatum]